jgi:diguanylate cyclase (GGDEF)-like protein
MVDLDHFKRINDSHGHPFGDRCLVAAAQCLTDIARRPPDLVARCGGEDFVVLMPNTPIEGARHVGQKLLQAVSGTTVTDEAHQITAQLSCSIGLASCQPGAHNDMSQLVEDADAALYFAKHNGRGQVACHGIDWPLAS